MSSLSLEVYKQRLLILELFPVLSPFLLTCQILKTHLHPSAPHPNVSQGPCCLWDPAPSPANAQSGLPRLSLGLPLAERVRP